MATGTFRPRSLPAPWLRSGLAGLLVWVVGCDSFLVSKCVLRPALPECTDLIEVQPSRLSRAEDAELSIELAQESVARELDSGTPAQVEIAQDGGPTIHPMMNIGHSGRTLYAHFPRAELQRLRGGAATLYVRIGERRVQAGLSLYTPPVYSGPPTIQPTPEFAPTQVRFHPSWRPQGRVPQPLLVQGDFLNAGLPELSRPRACWLSASLELPKLSPVPNVQEISMLDQQCPLSGITGCRPAFDSAGCLLQLCVRTGGAMAFRVLSRSDKFLEAPVSPQGEPRCPPIQGTLSFPLNSDVETDLHSPLVGVLWQPRAPRWEIDPKPELAPPVTLHFLAAAQLDMALSHSIEGQGFAVAHAALGELDQPHSPPPAQRTGDLVALSRDGLVKILLQRPSSFRELAEPAWQLGQELRQTGPVAFAGYSGLAVADVDGDGWQDIVVWGRTQAGRPRLVYAANLQGRSFTGLVDLPLPPAVDERFASAGMAVGDADGDGDPDLVLFVNMPSPARPMETLGYLALLRNEAR